MIINKFLNPGEKDKENSYCISFDGRIYCCTFVRPFVFTLLQRDSILQNLQ